MALPRDIKDQILDIIGKVLKANHRVILFGSYATGKENQFSDIDISIDARIPLDTAMWSIIEESFEESSIIQKIDVVDYHRVKKEFRDIIDRDGINLLDC